MIIWQVCITLANDWWKCGERAGTWKPNALSSTRLSEVNKLLGQSQARMRRARQKATPTPKKLKPSAEMMLLKATNKQTNTLAFTSLANQRCETSIFAWQNVKGLI